MKCKHCSRTTKKLMRRNPVIKGKYLTYHYCKGCETVFTVMKTGTGDPIVLSRPLMEDDRIEGDSFTPWHSR